MSPSQLPVAMPSGLIQGIQDLLRRVQPYLQDPPINIPGYGRVMEAGIPNEETAGASAAKLIPTHDIINARNSMYHATDLDGFNGIMNSGQIRPGMYAEYAGSNPTGVSVSRVPKVAPQADKPISIVLDPAAMGRQAPFAESLNKKPTSGFEFENRTPGSPVDVKKAAKGIIVDRQALRRALGNDADMNGSLQAIADRARTAGLPFKSVANAQQLQSYRAAFSRLSPQDMWGLVAGAAGLGGASATLGGRGGSQ